MDIEIAENCEDGGIRWPSDAAPNEKAPLAEGSEYFFYPRTNDLSNARKIFEAYVDGILSQVERDKVQWLASRNDSVHDMLSAHLSEYEESLAVWDPLPGTRGSEPDGGGRDGRSHDREQNDSPNSDQDSCGEGDGKEGDFREEEHEEEQTVAR